MRRFFAGTLLVICAAILLAPTTRAGADQLITFDDINTGATGDVYPISNPYAGLTWNNFGVLSPATSGQCLKQCGYYFGIISSPNVAFNILGNPASFSSSTPFTLNSFYLTADENDGLIVSVTGLLKGTPVDTASFTLSSTSPTLATLNWANIDEVDFFASGGTPHGWVLPNGFHIPSGTHFALDNVSINAVLAITSGIAIKYRLELVSLTPGNNNRLWLFVNNTWAHLDNTLPGLQDSVQNAFNTGSNLVVEMWFDNTQTIVGLVVRSP
jgi:hypothetical protein